MCTIFIIRKKKTFKITEMFEETKRKSKLG